MLGLRERGRNIAVETETLSADYSSLCISSAVLHHVKWYETIF